MALFDNFANIRGRKIGLRVRIYYHWEQRLKWGRMHCKCTRGMVVIEYCPDNYRIGYWVLKFITLKVGYWVW